MTAMDIALSLSLRVSACGAVTAVGQASAPTFAALRGGIAAFQRTSYRTTYGEPIIGAPVLDLKARALGREYLAALASPALDECLNGSNHSQRARTGLLLGVSETLPAVETRHLLKDLAKAHGLNGTSQLALLPAGDHSVLYGLAKAAEWIDKGIADRCVVGGVNTYLTRAALRDLERERRLKTSRNSDGVIPGEAACFVAVARNDDAGAQASGVGLVVRGLGLSEPGGESVRRGDGLTRAMRGALAGAGLAARQIDFRPSNQSGESVPALESGIAGMRVFREPGPYPPAWLPSESIGLIGSPVGALLLGWAATGFAKEYAPGEVALLEFASSDRPQGALVVTAG